MAKIKVGIVEDEMIIAQGIAHALHELGYDTTEPAISYTEALGMIVSERPDVVLLDIQLKGHKDGIELAKKIKEEYHIPFIFLTANADAATVSRAKELNPPAYLVKPFNKSELFAAIEICQHNFSVADNKTDTSEKDNYHIKDCLFIKHGANFHKIKTEDILYIESDNIYINVHTRGIKYLVRQSIQNYLDLIGARHFMRVHKSFAINTSHIDQINAASVFINGKEIPIGKTYREELLSFLRLS